MAESPTRPWVDAFADEMERKLSTNRHKGDRQGWSREKAEWLLGCPAPMRRLGTLSRKTKLRKVSKKEVRAKDLDALSRQVIFKRDGYKCLRCGATKNLNWCHVHSRRFKATRWAEWNLMTLCAGCHFWWHDRPVEASTWWRNSFPARYLMLMDSPAEKVGKREMETMKAELEAMLTTDGRGATEGQ